MMDGFEKIDVKSLTENPFRLLDDEWMLITAGTAGHFNMMTASWGTLGILWNRAVAICFIRPQRYTRLFADASAWFTLSFFPEKYRPALELCGSKSGRHINKIRETGLTPLPTERGNIIYAEARLAMECRKLYHDDFDPAFYDAGEVPQEIYPSRDFHRFYIGEITACWKALKK